MLTTKDNPGSFKPRTKRTFRSFLSRIYGLIKSSSLRALFNFLIAEGINILNERLLYRIKPKKYYCPNCNNNLSYFVHISNDFKIAWNSACPHCSGRARHRGLKFLYDELLNISGKPVVLHFAPEPILSVHLRQYNNINYKTTDYLLEDVDYRGEDIQALSFDDNSFDVVLCNHVIEHVPDDRKALEELNRILRPGGKAVITIPGDWSREKTIYFKDLRYNGHYRDYGMEVVQLMKSVFQEVTVKNLHDYNVDPVSGALHGIPKFEPAFICTKK